MSTPLTQNILKQYVYPSVDFKHDYDQNLKSRCYEVIIVIIKRLILKITSPHQIIIKIMEKEILKASQE